MLALICSLVARNFTAADDLFPSELVDFVPAAQNPVFTADGSGHWDVKIRERGWILREDDVYHLWFTGYDGTREGTRLLGYATSPDGLKWTHHPHNPVYRDGWVEDMMVIKQADTYYMFAEGRGDQAQLLTSKDRVHWTRIGPLNIRTTDNKPIPQGPYGTPTAWFENETWYLFYEQRDLGIWLARSHDLKVWKHVQDEPVIALGPGEYDKVAVALNQILKHNGRYYACYHGSPGGERPYKWTSNLATSTDLIHWTKYPGNPITSAAANKSSNLLIHDGKSFRMYTMHEQVDVYSPRQARR